MRPIDLKVTVDRPMPEAQTEILGDIEPRMRSFNFAGHGSGASVNYRPKVVLPTVWLIRRILNEHVLLSFKQQGQVTEVRVTGKLRDTAYDAVTETLSGS